MVTTKQALAFTVSLFLAGSSTAAASPASRDLVSRSELDHDDLVLRDGNGLDTRGGNKLQKKKPKDKTPKISSPVLKSSSNLGVTGAKSDNQFYVPSYKNAKGEVVKDPQGKKMAKRSQLRTRGGKKLQKKKPKDKTPKISSPVLKSSSNLGVTGTKSDNQFYVPSYKNAKGEVVKDPQGKKMAKRSQLQTRGKKLQKKRPKDKKPKISAPVLKSSSNLGVTGPKSENQFYVPSYKNAKGEVVKDPQGIKVARREMRERQEMLRRRAMQQRR